jgi:hypothetical protein
MKLCEKWTARAFEERRKCVEAIKQRDEALGTLRECSLCCAEGGRDE